MKHRLLVVVVASVGLAQLGGCASGDYGGTSSSGMSSHSAFYYGSSWYNYPYYYDDPDYVVVPPDRPGELPVRPENPIARPPPGERPRPTPLPAEGTSSRMPKAQPRVSTPRARPSIPSMPRGGLSRGGGRRR